MTQSQLMVRSIDVNDRKQDMGVIKTSGDRACAFCRDLIDKTVRVPVRSRTDGHEYTITSQKSASSHCCECGNRCYHDKRYEIACSLIHAGGMYYCGEDHEYGNLLITRPEPDALHNAVDDDEPTGPPVHTRFVVRTDPEREISPRTHWTELHSLYTRAEELRRTTPRDMAAERDFLRNVTKKDLRSIRYKKSKPQLSGWPTRRLYCDECKAHVVRSIKTGELYCSECGLILEPRDLTDGTASDSTHNDGAREQIISPDDDFVAGIVRGYESVPHTEHKQDKQSVTEFRGEFSAMRKRVRKWEIKRHSRRRYGRKDIVDARTRRIRIIHVINDLSNKGLLTPPTTDKPPDSYVVWNTNPPVPTRVELPGLRFRDISFSFRFLLWNVNVRAITSRYNELFSGNGSESGSGSATAARRNTVIYRARVNTDTVKKDIAFLIGYYYNPLTIKIHEPMTDDEFDLECHRMRVDAWLNGKDTQTGSPWFDDPEHTDVTGRLVTTRSADIDFRLFSGYR